MDEYLAQYPQLRALAEEMHTRGQELDEILSALRDRCPSIIQSIKVVRDVMQVPLTEAKMLVQSSSAWSDVEEDHAAFHEDAEAVYGDMVQEHEDGSSILRIDLTKPKPPE